MTAAPARTAEMGPLRVMIVDDSLVVRGMLGKWLGEDPAFQVVAIANSAEDALRRIATCDPELCVLDVEMPGLSGIEVLPQLLAARPGLRVVMASATTTAGAATSLKALDLGAADCIGKPAARDAGGSSAWRDELFRRLKGLGAGLRGRRTPGPTSAGAAPRLARGGVAPELVVVGSSTGGPPALAVLLRGLAQGLRAPMLITQHMPASFTAIMARNLAQGTGLTVLEAVHDGLLDPGSVYIAPGDFHMRVARRQDRFVTLLDQGPPLNFCRPSVDPLFATAAEICGPRLLAVMLTGMGHDGREGARAVAARGGRVIAQDEATSVVWGMPGAVVEAGLANAVLPLASIPEAVLGCFGGASR